MIDKVQSATRDHDAEMEGPIDLEEYAKTGKIPPPAKRYLIRIDKEKFEVSVQSMTGREILALVNKTPEAYVLSQKFKGGRVEVIKPEQVVKFTDPGVERFQTLARDPTEG
jgi:hypothetical protein